MVNFSLMLPIDELLRWAFITAGTVLCLSLLAEWLQLHRVKRVTRLVFGPKGKLPPLYGFVSFLRITGLTLMAAGMTFLAGWLGHYEPKTGGDGTQTVRHPHHVVFVLDVSPSMLFSADAGPDKKEIRLRRAEVLYRSVINRLRTEGALYSVIAFWKDAKVVVKDTPDINILDNIFDGLPLTYAMNSGGEKTSLPAALDCAAKLAKGWEAESGTLIFLTDGDVLPEKGLAQMPPAYQNVLIFGVGDPVKGCFIDDHYSRQARSSLNDLASRYGGIYFNANELLPGSEFFSGVKAIEGRKAEGRFNLRSAAIGALSTGALFFALSPLILSLFAGGWTRRAGHRETGGEA